MRKILRWLGIRGGIALLLGAVVAALTGSFVFGAVATGIVMLVVVNIAAFLYLDRGIAPRGGAASGAPHMGGAGGVVGPEAGDGCGAGGFDGGGGFGGGDGGGGGGGR